MKDLSPIVVFLYNRPSHTKLMFESLSKNHLSCESVLVVYCDGPKDNATPEELEKIEEVHEIVKEQNWPIEKHVFFSKTNIGCRDNIIRGISETLKKYGKAIVVEDDIITSPYFLLYMNKALSYYENRKSVFSISGHSHSPSKFVIPKDYEYDVYASPRLFNWGWGTWLDRWEQADWSFSYYDEFVRHPYEIDAFCRSGDDMIRMLIEEKNGQSSAWDIQFAFAHFMNNAISIVPCKSYTRNIGLDGSGTHCSIVNKKSEIELCQIDSPRFLPNLYLDSRIMNLQYSLFCSKKKPIWKKVVNRISRLLGKQSPFLLRGKVYYR